MRTGLIIALIIALIVDVILLVYGITRQDRTRALGFTAIMAAILMYALGYLLELMNENLDSVITALKVENIGIPLVAPFFLLCCIGLYHPKLYRNWIPVAIAVYGVLMIGSIILNDYHYLYYSTIGMRYGSGSYFVHLGKGPLYVVQQTVSISCMLVTYAILFTRYLKGNRKFRAQMRFIIIGSFLSFFANIANFTQIMPIGLDVTPFAMTAGMALFSIDMFRYKLMDLTSYATSNAVNTMDDAFIALDMEWEFMFCNQSAIRLFPELEDCLGWELVGQEAWWPPELSSEAGLGGVTFTRPDTEEGAERTYRANISAIKGLAGKPIGWSIVIRNITDTADLMVRLEQLAIRDPLTGIFNRRHFTEMVNRELAKAERYNIRQLLVMFDLDHFKNVNDIYGHHAGDHMLRSVTETVENQLRPYDLFARYGGEEFVIFANIEEGSNPTDLPERLRYAIMEAKIEYEGQHIPITASFGAVTIHTGTSLDEALRSVDEAMYRAKASGRNCVVYESMKIPVYRADAVN